MKKVQKIGIQAAAAIVVFGAGGYGAWVAWDKGKLGNNPRAPTARAMENAVRLQATYLTMTTGARIPCLSIDNSFSQAEIRSIPGIGPQAVPGQHAVTMLLQTNTRNQQARDAHLAQLGYLAKQGLLAVADTTVTTDDGVGRPAKTFRLTWQGFAEARASYGSSICLNYGKREFAGIEQIEKTLEKMMDLDVYEVTYKTAVKGVPGWAATEEARRSYPKLAELTADGTGKAKVIRTKEGWRSAFEIEAEISAAAKGGNPTQLAGTYLQAMKQQLEAKPTIGLEEANQLAAQYLTDPDRFSNAGVACLPLNLQRGGDEKDAQGERDTTVFSVTYYDRSDRKPYEYQNMARTLHILSALEGAGLAEMDMIRPALPLPMSGRRSAPQPVEPPKPVGLRFTVSKEAMAAMGISGYGGGCIPAGKTKYEVLAVRESPENSQTNVVVRATIEQTPEWAAKIAERLPALKTILDNGLPANGSAYQAAEAGVAGKWKLSGLHPNYPALHYESIPGHLTPLMPVTAAAFYGKPVKAPALVPELRGVPAPAAGVPDYGTPLPAPAPAAPPADSYQPAPQPYKPALPSAPKRMSSGPLYPAEGSPVHVISIGEAPLPGGTRGGSQQQSGGVTSVSVTEPNATLLLFAYHPVEWRINAPSGVKLKRVVAVGFYDQRIVFNGGGKPEVTAGKIETIAAQSGIDRRSFEIPRMSDANALNGIAALTQALTGVLPSSFQAAGVAPEAGFTIGAGTPKFALPAPRAPGAVATAVVLRDSEGGKLIDGNKTRRGPAGAYDEVWTDQIYSAGKAFFEGTMRVTGSLGAHSHANIGLCLATENAVSVSRSREIMALAINEQRLYKDGDVFGIAADFDNQIMYHHVNGKWQTGAPGSGSGKKLQKGVEYRACFLAAGSTSSGVARGEKQSDTTWEINFGSKPFTHPLPAGYRPFQGGTV